MQSFIANLSRLSSDIRDAQLLPSHPKTPEWERCKILSRFLFCYRLDHHHNHKQGDGWALSSKKQGLAWHSTNFSRVGMMCLRLPTSVEQISRLTRDELAKLAAALDYDGYAVSEKGYSLSGREDVPYKRASESALNHHIRRKFSALLDIIRENGDIIRPVDEDEPSTSDAASHAISDSASDAPNNNVSESSSVVSTAPPALVPMDPSEGSETPEATTERFDELDKFEEDVTYDFDRIAQTLGEEASNLGTGLELLRNLDVHVSQGNLRPNGQILNFLLKHGQKADISYDFMEKELMSILRKNAGRATTELMFLMRQKTVAPELIDFSVELLQKDISTEHYKILYDSLKVILSK